MFEWLGDTIFWKDITADVIAGIILILIGGIVAFINKEKIYKEVNNFLNQRNEVGGDNVTIQGGVHNYNWHETLSTNYENEELDEDLDEN